MHDYMKALYHRFEAPSRRTEYMDRKIKRTHSQLARVLGKSEKKLLLRIADTEDELRDEVCLNSFISDFRLAQSIQRSCWQTSRPTASRQKTSGRPAKSSHREKAANNTVKNCDGVNKEEFLQRRRFK